MFCISVSACPLSPTDKLKHIFSDNSHLKPWLTPSVKSHKRFQRSMKGVISNWLSMLCSKSNPTDFYNFWGETQIRKVWQGREELSRLSAINQNCFLYYYLPISWLSPHLNPPPQKNKKKKTETTHHLFGIFLLLMESVRNRLRGW